LRIRSGPHLNGCGYISSGQHKATLTVLASINRVCHIAIPFCGAGTAVFICYILNSTRTRNAGSRV
jgi:hypothetical protein